MPLSQDLRAFDVAATVIEEGSMSAAATRLGLTQSSISQAVKRAENIIGAALLWRDRRPLAPTEAGRVLVTQMREVNQRVERAVEEIRAAALRPERQDLRFGMIDTFASTVGPMLMRDLMEGAMALRLTAFSGLTTSHAEALVRHSIDAAVISDSLEELDGLDRYPLLREPFVLVCPVAWADTIAGRGLRDIFAEHRLIRFSARSHTGVQIERHLRRVGVEPEKTLSFDTSDSLMAMVASGMGVTISTPLCLLQAAIHLPALAILPLPGPGFSREILFVTRQGEFTTLGPRIATAARDLIRRYTLPQIDTMIPWLAGSASAVTLPDPATAPEDRIPDQGGLQIGL